MPGEGKATHRAATGLPRPGMWGASGSPAEEGWRQEAPLNQNEPPLPPGGPSTDSQAPGRGSSLGNAGLTLGDRKVRGSDTSWSPPST